MAPVAVAHSFADSLNGLYDSSQAALESLPKAEVIYPPENGISLLDAKNEIFLSYLQSLAVRNLEIIRSVKQYLPGTTSDTKAGSSGAVRDEVVDDLIRQRVYLDKGVRPLEEKLKYTIDKTIRAADEQDRKTKQTETAKATNGKTRGTKDKAASGDEDSNSESSSSEEDAPAPRANLAALAEVGRANAAKDRDARDSKAGVYRPPRVSATSMPEPSRREGKRERPARSRTLDEYVNTEMSAGPVAEPSIGSTITQGGRRQMSAKEREVEAEKREYEETHLTRLMEGKKEKAAKRARDGGFGGEDWKGLGEGLERIDGLVKGTKKREKEGALEKSRKRRATEDSVRQDGTAAGGLFDRRKKRMMKKLQ